MCPNRLLFTGSCPYDTQFHCNSFGRLFTVAIRSGRLYQVEYAMEAISHAGTCLGILATDGVLLAAERKNINKLLDDSVFKSEKMYKLNQ